MRKSHSAIACATGAALASIVFTLGGATHRHNSAPPTAIGATASDAFLVTIGPDHQVFLLYGSGATTTPMPEPRSYAPDDMIIYQQQLRAWERERAESQHARTIPVMLTRNNTVVNLTASSPVTLAGQQFLLEAHDGTLVRIGIPDTDEDTPDAIHAQPIAPVQPKAE